MMERVVCWALAITLSVLLAFTAVQQLFGPSPNPVFGLIELRSGIGLFEPYGRYATALLEVIAIALLLWPRTRTRGALLALVIAVVALGFHLSPWLGVAVPLPDAYAAAAAGGLQPEAAARLPNDDGAMFILALAIAVLSMANLWFERILAKVSAPKPKRPAGAYA